MSEISELSEEQIDFLRTYLPGVTDENKSLRPDDDDDEVTEGQEGYAVHDGKVLRRPFVTLTYASSLDSMISFAPGVRTTLSGEQAKNMTHYLRLHHDAILVGVGTAKADDPGLNCRYPGVTLESQPRPVIVDPSRRWQVEGSKVEALATAKQGKAPWIISAQDLAEDTSPHRADVEAGHDCQRTNRKYESLQQGAGDGAHRMSWSSILHALKLKAIHSVMIEGGATVINELLLHQQLVDSIILTIAPTWLGQGGIVVSPASVVDRGQRVNAARLGESRWKQFGDDVVLCGRPCG